MILKTACVAPYYLRKAASWLRVLGRLSSHLQMNSSKPTIFKPKLNPILTFSVLVLAISSSSLVYPQQFSSCSQQQLSRFLEEVNPACLLNIPSTDRIYGGPVCGNAFLEPGEECDCGTVEVCAHCVHTANTHNVINKVHRRDLIIIFHTHPSASQECKNPCCNATTCKLNAGAQCAEGGCCQNCQVSNTHCVISASMKSH